MASQLSGSARESNPPGALSRGPIGSEDREQPDRQTRADTPNHYARALHAAVRGAEPEAPAGRAAGRGLHRGPLARATGLAGRRLRANGEARLEGFYRAPAGAEERHAEIFLDLARPLVPPDAFEARLAELAQHEAFVLASLPHASRVH